jgi:hypothetical protein
LDPDQQRGNPEPQTESPHILRSIGLFALGFALTAAVLHGTVYALAHDPLYLYAYGRSEKLSLMNQLRGQDFSAAFGSSHVQMGFNPLAFDRTLAGSPLATTTANLAVQGGSQSEQRRMALEWVEHFAPPPIAAGHQPCLIVLELNAGANLPDNNLVHPRSINLYDWPTTRLTMSMVDASMALKQRAGRIGVALFDFGLHSINLGMLSNFIFAPPEDTPLLTRQSQNGVRGQLVETTPATPTDEVRNELASRPAQTPIEATPLTPGNMRMVEEIDAASPVKTLAPVYLVMPMVSDTHRIHAYPDHFKVDGKTVPIINMARPDLFPELYQARLWHDAAHLDGPGAELLSSLFAKRLAAWYAEHGGPPPCNG